MLPAPRRRSDHWASFAADQLKELFWSAVVVVLVAIGLLLLVTLDRLERWFLALKRRRAVNRAVQDTITTER
jgi:hypothetical protein